MKKLSVILFVFTFYFLLFTCGAAVAAIPGNINYQGKLTTPVGELVADGLYKMVFKLYQDNSTLIWTETFDGGDKVRVTNGVYNVVLGTGANDGDLREMFEDYDNLYLGMTVEDDTEMSPRPRVASVGYALLAGETAADNPIGTIKMYIDTSPPSGWLVCDGSAVSRTTYDDLFTVIGTAYGTGDGSTTFNLPDLQDRFPIGKSGTRSLGATGGAETVNLAHSHTVNSHSHSISTASLNHHHSYSISVGGGSHSHHVVKDLYSCIGDCSDGANDSSSNATVLSESHGHRVDFWVGDGSHSHSASGYTGYYNLSHNHGGTTGPYSPGTNSRLSSTQSIMPPFQVVTYVIKY